MVCDYVSSMLSKAKSEYYIKEYECCKSNMNDEWKFFNKVIKQDFLNKSGPIKINKNNEEITDALEIAECLNDHFINIGKELAAKLPVTNYNYQTFLKNLPNTH